MICRECGAENREGLAVCANCGTSLPEPQTPKKSRRKWLLAAGASLVVLLSAIVLTCALSTKSYERNAKRFVQAALENDMQQVEELLAPCIYAYAGDNLDMGQGVERCRVKMRSSERMGSMPLLDYNRILVSLDSEWKMTDAYYVTVSYECWQNGEKSAAQEMLVVVGLMGEKWYVITVEPS